MCRLVSHSLLGLVLALLASASELSAQCETILTPSQPQQLGSYGQAGAILGDRLVVAAPGQDLPGGGDGALFVYELDGSGWNEIQFLTSSMPTSGLGLGWSLALDEDHLVAGAPFDVSVGQVHAFQTTATGYGLEQIIDAPAGVGSRFGRDLELNGDMLAIGAPGISGAVSGPMGRVYLYELNGTAWELAQTLIPSPVELGDQPGESVSFEGDTLLMGAPHFGAFSGEGGAFVFRFNGTSWVQEQLLVAPPAVGFNDKFGETVELAGDTLFVAAPGVGSNEGLVFVYDFDGVSWTLVQTLEPPYSPTNSRFFGWDIHADGDVAWITGGSWFMEYRRVGGTWTLNFMKQSPNFARTMATDGVRAVFPAIDSNMATQEVGQASVFAIDCVAQSFVRSDCNGDGSTDIADPILSLSYLFTSGAEPGCLDACDIDDNGALDLSDVILALGTLFIPGSPEPLPPFPACGGDTTIDTLGCGEFAVCPD